MRGTLQLTSFILKLCGLLAMGALGFWWIGRGVWRARRAESEVNSARQAFAADLPTLKRRLLDVAHSDWRECDLLPSEPLLARDVATGELYALTAIEITFEADSTPRQATAVFIWRNGQWMSEGRVVLDLEPQETLNQHKGSLVSI